jgi:anti-sigma regulatory factor (Ser/Thr protein kinase)
VVRDEGSGFDHASHIYSRQQAFLGDHDRGLTLMRTFMDGVTFNEAGNEVTLIKRRPKS